WLPSENPRRAAVSAMGFGGTNFHVVLEEAQTVKPETDWDGDIEIAALSAGDIPALKAQLPAWQEKRTWDDLRRMARQSRETFKASAKCRLCLVLENGKTDAQKLAVSAAKMLDSGQESWTLPEGAFYGGAEPQETAVLFPGQGAQYPGMLKDITRAFSPAMETAARAARLEVKGARLGALLYPAPSFDQSVKKRQAELLKDTAAAQPALGAVELAAWKTLALFGLKPAAFAGHSYGELAALCAAGSFQDDKFFALSALRGALMSGEPGTRGGMIAVQAPLPEIDKALREEKISLVTANKNAPLQTVLSGKIEELDRALQALSKRGIKAVKLQVSAGFHSPFVADAKPRFAEGIVKAEFKPPVVPVYANKTAAPYPHDAAACAEILAAQLASPVEFVAMIEAMYARGIRVFVETGPGARLTGLVDAILSGKPHAAFSLDASSGAKSGLLELARALARLSSLGAKLDLSQWELPLPEPEKSNGYVMQLTGSNYRTPRQAPPLPKLDAPAAQPQAPAYLPPTGFAALPPQVSAGGNSLQSLQDSMNRLAAMQEQAALLHAKYLENQEQAQRALQELIEQQQRLIAGQPLAAMPPLPPLPKPVAAPAPQAYVSAPVAPVAPRPAPAKAASNVEKTLIAIVSAQTGYLVEALKPEMDMESDLGIDSIKRVAILAEVQEKLPGAPQIKPEHLGTMRTLRQVADYLSQGNAHPVPATAQPQQAAPAVSANSSNVEKTLIAIVSAQTGYPVEALKPEMDMESDLGIDSIKRVAILAEVQEKLPGAPQIKPEHLGTMRTLRQVADYLSQGSAQPVAAAPAQPQQQAAQSSSADVQKNLISIVSAQTGYPVEALKPEMDMESDLGIDSIKRVAILAEVQEKLPGAPQIKPEHLGTMRTLRQVADYLSQGSAQPVAAAPAQSAPVEQLKSGSENVEKTLIEIVSAQTGYPVEALKPEMDMESDLGIDSIKR
ncbi:MAG: acyltransferase domain-containing protein, partial [Elusimicrobia bacterium]|nr:acyltransferase domain-containing protein [Elusimicrobiota bacterium]